MKVVLILLGVLILLVCIHDNSFAHELLPRPVVEYLKQHPNASASEIEQFIQGSAPALAKKIKSKEDVLRILNRKTNNIDNAFDFIRLGINHIVSGPDHVLFVLSLLLVFISLKEILKLTGTFTIAHSLTLILAGSGILTLSSHIVEPVIALSISYVALTSVFFRHKLFFSNRRSKVAAVFFFGLFHGLGFAGLLKEIQVPQDRFLSSLLSFNIGIELGQIFIVAITLPFIYFFQKRSWYSTCIKIAAGSIGAVGILWGVTRII